MNKAMKKRWITALRSGEYKQARNMLHASDGSMCCLGVLCDIEIDDDWEFRGCHYKIQGFMGGLPEALMIQSRLTAEDHSMLTVLNDPRHKSFDEIADFIEENL